MQEVQEVDNTQQVLQQQVDKVVVEMVVLDQLILELLQEQLILAVVVVDQENGMLLVQLVDLV
tara:strand:- start:45 stop:233 length:189 start_codon:yes stop_codon:yes gene_type:complete